MIKRRYFIVAIVLLVSICAVNIHMNNYYNNTIKELENAKNNTITVQNELKNELSATQEMLQTEVEKNEGLSKELGKLTHELSAANMIIEDLCNPQYELVYLGDFKYTYYCDERREHICGGSGITASGAPTEVGTTIAVDPTVIPLGTTVYIEGVGFRTAQDTGGAVKGQHVDILVDYHDEALAQTVLGGGVWILVERS